LHKAVRKGHEDIVNILLQRGADAKILNKQGDSFLHLAAKKWLSTSDGETKQAVARNIGKLVDSGWYSMMYMYPYILCCFHI
jgi:ankyrin repeat protein